MRLENSQTEELETLISANNYKNWILGFFNKFLGRRILEVGAGLGLYTEYLKDEGDVVGTEISAKHLKFLKRRFANAKNVTILNADIGDTSKSALQNLRKFKFDTIIFINVLEHIKNDKVSLKNSYNLLEKGGRVLIFVPAFPILFGSIDQLVGHYRRYKKNALSKKLLDAGFKIEKIRYFNFVGFFGWWFNNRVMKAKKNSSAQVQIFDKLIVPIASRIERVVPPPFGQSLGAIGVKEDD